MIFFVVLRRLVRLCTGNAKETWYVRETILGLRFPDLHVILDDFDGFWMAQDYILCGFANACVTLYRNPEGNFVCSGNHFGATFS